MFKRTGKDIPVAAGRDIWMHEAMLKASPDCAPEKMESEDTLFLLYTSGSTGKPKGVAHSTAGYLLNATMVKIHIQIVQYFCFPCDDKLLNRVLLISN